MSFFFTALRGSAVCMDTMTVSPMRAYRRWLPPGTLKTRASLPPELSATCTMDCGCKILFWSLYRCGTNRTRNTKALHPRDGARGDNGHRIAECRGVTLVVDQIFL